MAEIVKVKIKRVKSEEVGTRVIAVGSLFTSEYPADGFVIQIDGSGSLPLYVRDEDIEEARRVRDEKGKAVTVTAQSWDSQEEER